MNTLCWFDHILQLVDIVLTITSKKHKGPHHCCFYNVNFLYFGGIARLESLNGWLWLIKES